MAKYTNTMEMPRKIVMGSEILDELKGVVDDLGFQRPTIICDKVTYEIAASYLSDLLSCPVIFATHADYSEVEKIVDELPEGTDVIVGVGGGTIIDLAKLSSRLRSIPFISVPTAASHDGIASSRASIKNRDEKTSIQALPPVAVVADTHIISQAPYRFLAAGYADLISNYTAVKDWELAHRLKGEYFSEYSHQLSLLSAKLMIKNADIIKEGNERAARKVLKGLISSGIAMSIAGSSRPASGSEHLFSHALDMIAPKPAMHGEQCGVGSIMMMYLHGGKWRSLKKALKTVKAPTNAEELDIEEDIILKALTISHTIRDRFTILGSEGLTEDAARNLAIKTGVIKE